MFRKSAILGSVALFAASVTSLPLLAADAPRPPRPLGGPLAPDSPEAKGYNDAAKALAHVDANPMINWAYRVWCETGYRTKQEAGEGQEIDPLPMPIKDLVTPKGFLYTDASKQMPAGGVQFMDNAWYFGTDLTGMVVVKVPEGLLMFDALTTPDDMENQVITEMKRAGLNPADVRYIFMGHQHGDHIGGANLIRQKYAPGVKFVMGKPDADAVTATRAKVLSGDLSGPFGRPAPANETPQQFEARKNARLMALPDKIDISIPAFAGMTNGMQKIKIGESTEVIAAVTPGHTIGQMSVIVPVVYKGQPHKLVIWSGNDNINAAAQYATSIEFFRSIANLEGADGFINTHGYQGAAFNLLREMKANPSMSSPMLLGKDGVQRYLGVLSQCHQAQARRLADGTWKAL